MRAYGYAENKRTFKVIDKINRTPITNCRSDLLANEFHAGSVAYVLKENQFAIEKKEKANEMLNG